METGIQFGNTSLKINPRGRKATCKTEAPACQEGQKTDTTIEDHGEGMAAPDSASPYILNTKHKTHRQAGTES